MEELKLQLAERMPGVISAMADAAGFGADQAGIAKLFKAMEAGEVKAAEVLPKFAKILSEKARAGGALTEAMKTSSAEQQRFNNAVTAMIEIMGGNGLETGFARIFKSMAVFLEENEEGVITLSRAFEKFSVMFEGFLNSLSIGINYLDKFTDRMGMAEGSLLGVLAAGLMMLNPFTRILTIFSGLMLIMEDLYVYSQGGDSVFGQWMDGLDGETFKVMKDFLADVSNLGDQTSIAVDKITTSFGKLIEYLGESGIGGNVLRSTISSLGFMVDHLTTLVTMAGMVAQGDLMGAAKVGAERGLGVVNSFSRNAAGAVDLLLPGKPLTGGMDSLNSLINQNTPEGRAFAAQQAASQRTSNWEANRGSGSDVPPVTNNFTINGVTDPEGVAKVVVMKIEEMTKNAIKNTPLTE
jgi:hypothetical protein